MTRRGSPSDVPRAELSLALALAIYAPAFLVLAWPWLSGAVTIPWDAKSQFFPQVQFLARTLANGETPFWAPNVFAGWPQIADPQALIFSPLHVLAALLDSAPGFRAVDAVTFVQLFLGGLGIILYFKDRGWHAAGALIAAIAFAFGGAAASRLQHTGQVASLSLLPIVLWLLARALERSSWRYGLASGAVAGLMAVGGDQVGLLGLYLLVAFVIVHWIPREGRGARFRASLTPLIAGAVAGALVIAGPILMAALLAADSNRPVFDFVSAGHGSLHPAHLLTLAFPDLYGAADPAVAYWGPPSFEWKAAFGPADLFLAQNMGQLYAGALPLVAVLGPGMVRGLMWERDIRFFTVAAAIAILYAIGWYTPLFRAMYEVLPGISLFRRPADAAFLAGALIAILGGYCVHRWLDASAISTVLQRALDIVLVAGITGAATYCAARVGTLDAAYNPLTSGLLWAAGAVIVLAMAPLLHGRNSVAAILLLAAFTTADLAWNNAPNESTGLPPATYDALRPGTTNETVNLLKTRLAATAAPDRRDRVELIGIGYHWPNLPLAQDLDHVLGHNPLRLKWFFDATRVGDTVAAPDQRTFSPLFPSYRSTFADLFGLRLIATGVPVEQIDSSLKPGDLTFLARTNGAFVYENPRALPRVMLLTDWKQVDFAALVAGGWPPETDPRRTVLLEKAPGVAFSPGGAPGTARPLRYANTEVIVEVEAPAGGILLLNDVWHPWWRASLDDAETELLKANAIFRAVAVPPGRHTVRFTFHPFSGALRELIGKLRGR